MRQSWDIHGTVMRQSWDSHETVMRQPWDSHETVMRQSWHSHDTVRRQSGDSHDTVYYSTPVAGFSDMSVLVCSVRDQSISDVPTGWPHDHGLPFRERPWKKTGVCNIFVKGLQTQRLIGSAVAGFNHAKKITKASATDLHARQNDYNKGIWSPGSLFNHPVR